LASIDEFLTSLRSEFGEQEAGKKFEVFCKWFLENDPHWAKAIDKIWLWNDYPQAFVGELQIILDTSLDLQ
jgi:predicted helicase